MACEPTLYRYEPWCHTQRVVRASSQPSKDAPTTGLVLITRPSELPPDNNLITKCFNRRNRLGKPAYHDTGAGTLMQGRSKRNALNSHIKHPIKVLVSFLAHQKSPTSVEALQEAEPSWTRRILERRRVAVLTRRRRKAKSHIFRAATTLTIPRVCYMAIS